MIRSAKTPLSPLGHSLHFGPLMSNCERPSLDLGTGTTEIIETVKVNCQSVRWGPVSKFLLSLDVQVEQYMYHYDILRNME